MVHKGLKNMSLHLSLEACMQNEHRVHMVVHTVLVRSVEILFRHSEIDTNKRSNSVLGFSVQDVSVLSLPVSSCRAGKIKTILQTDNTIYISGTL